MNNISNTTSKENVVLVGVSKQQTPQQNHDLEEGEIKEETKRHDSNDMIGSNLLILANDDEEPMFSAVLTNSELRKADEEPNDKEMKHNDSVLRTSLLDAPKLSEDSEFFSCDIVHNEDGDSDDESYVDDYLKLMED